jgi:hypothetical protein
MMAANRSMCQAVNAVRAAQSQAGGGGAGGFVSRWWSRLLFHVQFRTVGLMMGVLPQWLLLKIQMRGDFPPADRKLLRDTDVGRHLIASVQHSMSPWGSCRAMEGEARVLFRSEPPAFHETLRAQMDGRACGDGAAPRVAVYHGRADKNVPFGHGRYVHERVLCGRGTFRAYDGLGHVSLLRAAAGDVARFAVPSASWPKNALWLRDRAGNHGN